MKVIVGMSAHFPQWEKPCAQKTKRKHKRKYSCKDICILLLTANLYIMKGIFTVLLKLNALRLFYDIKIFINRL